MTFGSVDRRSIQLSYGRETGRRPFGARHRSQASLATRSSRSGAPEEPRSEARETPSRAFAPQTLSRARLLDDGSGQPHVDPPPPYSGSGASSPGQAPVTRAYPCRKPWSTKPRMTLMTAPWMARAIASLR